MKAKLIDFAIVDEFGNLTSTLIKGDRFKLMSKVQFNEDVDDPIFTYISHMHHLTQKYSVIHQITEIL